jgi:hypothetical protein
MDFYEQDSIIVAGSTANAEEACQVFFVGDYHYCGDAGGGYVLCCPGSPS